MQSNRFATSRTRDTVPDSRQRNLSTRKSDLEPIVCIRPTEQGPRPELFITFDADMMPRTSEPARLTVLQKVQRMAVVAFFFLAAAACGFVLA